jgi:hypothetical protein
MSKRFFSGVFFKTDKRLSISGDDSCEKVFVAKKAITMVKTTYNNLIKVLIMKPEGKHFYENSVCSYSTYV